MFGPFLRATTGQAVVNGIYALQATGSPLHAVLVILAPILSDTHNNVAASSGLRFALPD
ncbi:hypothetical protein [Acetobacter fallax]|uniref:Uncharacterized protein n=1 Tax=Acetobacter fallax TaxID=1737473 RepID=A0ABX0K4W6_9PROT|nr:hypothetical protein [Acetobacter fallax]NHO31384.1 hypothetical protein [Acetobacter fallax]NHO35034.1 hypothetical protein [Acetobacter fallax]